MRRILLGTMMAAALAVLSFGPASAKTVKECNAEYSANKAAIKATEKKADFITACRAGTEVIPDAASAPAAPAAPAPTTTAAPAPAPSGGGIFGLGRKKPTPAAAPASTPAAPTTVTTGVPSSTQCPGSTLVWVNTKSGVYHFPGTHNYGNTKAGAYMCEANAIAAGDRASKTEKHP